MRASPLRRFRRWINVNNMDGIPEVTEARPTTGRRVWLRFADGEEGEVDLSRYLNYGPVFAPLEDEGFFRQLRVEAGTIAWPNGADIAPERLHELLVGCGERSSL